ncbi:MAG: hypothetical protein KY459_11970 [Acidobacteria bacterium]|nr:hypothetical protein [Acidobacteriota bacterium]
MAGIQQEITDTFLEKLRESEIFSSKDVEELRSLLATGEKPKAERIIDIISAKPKEKSDD